MKTEEQKAIETAAITVLAKQGVDLLSKVKP